MMKTDVDSILLANWYLTMCRLKSGSHKCSKTELARKYLVSKINRALFERTNNQSVQSNKALFDFKY